MKQKNYVLAVVIITSLLSCSQLFAASSGKCGENLTWTLDDEGNLVIEGTGEMEDYSYDNAPWGQDIKTILISDGIVSIGRCAFRNSSIEYIVMPNSVLSIGYEAFFNCESLKSIELPDSLICIGDKAFNNCRSLVSIQIPNSVSSIGYGAFARCLSLESIQIPNSVLSIGYEAFNNCRCLKSIELPDSVTSIESYTFSGCSSLVSVTFGNSVSSIGYGAFADCISLESIELPDSVTSIGNYTFSRCLSLKSFKIPDTITNIKDYTFSGCSSLESIQIPSSVTSIGFGAFSACSHLYKIELPNSVKEIGNSAFNDVEYPIIKVNAVNPPELKGKLPMTTAIVPNASVAAYKSAEYWKDMTILSQEKTEVEITMTEGVGLAEAIVKQSKIAPASVTAIKVHGSLTSDDIKTTLGINMLNCYSIDISDTDVEELPVDAFKGRTSLLSIKLPKRLKIIGNRAFSGCKFLENCDLETLSVVKIGNYSFYACKSLSHFNFPYKLESIGSYAFSDSKIEVVYFPETIKTIGTDSFLKCIWLKNADMSNLAINKIPDSMFNCCTSLEEVKLPATIESIGYSAFQQCSQLHNIELPSSVKTVGTNAFSGCKSLKVLNLSKSLTTIGNGAFGGCSSVEIINCPAQVPPTISSESTLKDINKNTCVLSIPSDKYIEYFSAPYWGQFLEYKSGVCVLVNEDNGCVKYTVNNIEAESSTNAIRTNALTQASVDESNINAEAFNNANICVNENMTITFKIIPNDGYMIGSVKYAGSDVTSQVINGVYTTPLVTGDAEFVVTFKEEFSSVDENEVTDNFKVWSDGMAIYVESGERITVNVTSLIGVTRTYVAESGVTEIKVAAPGIYIVNGKKVLVR